MNLVPYAAAIGGGLATFQGAHYMSGGGNFLGGINRVFFGLAAADLGARLMSISETFHQKIMHTTLLASAAFVAVKGGVNVVRSSAEKNIDLRLLGIAQMAGGIAANYFLQGVKAKIVAVLHEAILISLIGGFISSLNLKEFGERGKILSCVGGVIGAGYHIYQGLVEQVFRINPKINAFLNDHKINAFLNDHIEEIEKMFRDKSETEDWSVLGSGVSKIAFTHPDLPGFLIKIPRYSKSFWGYAESDVEANFEKLKEAQSLVQANNYRHIVIPQSELFKTKEGFVALEEKFEIVSYDLVADDLEKANAKMELKDFLVNGKYCDIYIEENHNCGFLKNKKTPQIGVFDLDCKIR